MIFVLYSDTQTTQYASFVIDVDRLRKKVKGDTSSTPLLVGAGGEGGRNLAVQTDTGQLSDSTDEVPFPSNEAELWKAQDQPYARVFFRGSVRTEDYILGDVTFDL